MDLKEKISMLAVRMNNQKDNLLTEEAVKTAFVLPFIKALGYDIFDPLEVIPEFTADHGVKKGEKVDYMIKINDETAIIIECKPLGSDLASQHASQLFRYFSVTDAKFSILTDGERYLFYTDLEKPNRMDERHFFEFNISKHNQEQIEQLKKFSKTHFDMEKILTTASDLKYGQALQEAIAQEFKQPSDELIKLLTSKVFDGRFSSSVKDKFQQLISSALSDFLRTEVNERLECALNKGLCNPSPLTQDDSIINNDEIMTTPEEIESHMIIRAICSEIVDPSRIFLRDAKSYCAILFDDNNRKPITRLYYGVTKMSIGIFIDGNEEKNEINKISDLYLYKDHFKKSVQYYLNSNNLID